MPRARLRPNILTLALAGAALMLSTTQVLAQASQRAQEAREARRAGDSDSGKNKSKSSESKNLFPDATREEPDGKASSKLSSKLQKMIDAYNDGKNPEARAAADAIIATESANAYERALANQIAAQAAYADSDNAAAKTYLKNAIDANGLDNNGHYQSMYMLAQLQMEDEQYAEALATLDRYLTETKSQKPEALVVKGNILYRLERYPEAIAALKQGIDAAGAEAKPDWQQVLMAAYFDSDQPAEAAKVAEGVLAKNPDDKKLQMNLASIYMQADQNDKAIALMEKMRAKGQLTEDKDYRNLYALYMNTDGKEKEGIAVIKEGLDKGVLKPDYQTYLALGQGYYFTDQPGPAIENYQKAAPLAPDGETYLNLAKILWGEGRLGEAKQAAQQALDKGIKNPADAKKILAQKG
ncbi:MAG TPA: tetratricopeptide repeat protein [Luteimonas sp.]|nr:tetratricopeptide repeat protein [Luteimonas sp.]